MALAAAVFVVLTWLAVATTAGVVDRSEDGFCRRSPGIDGATAFEERTWWPLGERCFVELADGTVLVREPTWPLTAFAAGWIAVVAVGVAAPARSTRRALAALLAVPLVAMAVVEILALDRVSLSRVVAITTVSLAWSVLPAAPTAVGVWWTVRGRILTIVLATWTGWAAAIFLEGRDAIQP